MDLKLYLESKKDYTEGQWRAFKLLTYKQKSIVIKVEDIFEIKK